LKNQVIPIIFIIFLPFILAGQDRLNENEIKSSLTQIFELSKEQDFERLGEKLLNDASLKPFNMKNKKDSKSVKRSGKKIKAYLDLSDSYEYKDLEFETFKDLPSANLNVIFRSGSQNLTISFIFVEVDNKILLAKFN
jgi:hypothetical protein